MNWIILVYFVIINIYSFYIMGTDKWKAVHRGRRVPEKIMFITALSGGALGIYLGMKLFHHKTLHIKFKLGIPVLLLLNLIFYSLLYIKLANKV